ncbi:thiolase C-terminal domain-containing protein [Pseudonocardia oroxyli]|uniref:thiolase C-terminal domain-containing protein n=1 Tax=Pseudonocardia oroxyli TaxID=366584 RepID=UPI001C40A5C4|nr:lipid-transfer protein [Pseudonocardia oroxyli]
MQDLDGFAIYSNSVDPAEVASVLGVPEVRFAASLTSGGGGSAGALGLAAAAIHSGMAEVVVSVMTLQQAGRRLGGTQVSAGGGGSTSANPYSAGGVPPSLAFTVGSGLLSPGSSFALLTQRHMHLYGTTREHLAEVAITQRSHAITRPTSLQTGPLTTKDYFASRMISDPLCLFDYTMENDGAVAAVMTSADRAKDLRHPPVYILGSAHGGAGRWGPAIGKYFQAPDEYFASSGHRPVAKRLYEMAGVTPDDVDVALLYDHFTPMVLMQLEDYGFCGVGESGPFVADGNIRLGGKIPVNTHGGHLSEAYIIGFTHVREAVEQLRGDAINQVAGAEIALVTGGPAGLPVSGTLLRR